MMMRDRGGRDWRRSSTVQGRRERDCGIPLIAVLVFLSDNNFHSSPVIRQSWLVRSEPLARAQVGEDRARALVDGRVSGCNCRGKPANASGVPRELHGPGDGRSDNRAFR